MFCSFIFFYCLIRVIPAFELHVKSLHFPPFHYAPLSKRLLAAASTRLLE